MSLLHHEKHTMPFEDLGDPVEADLRAQICRLHDERRDLIGLIDRQRVENAKQAPEIHRLRRHVAHLERLLAKRRWRPWR